MANVAPLTIRADLAVSAVVPASAHRWVASPEPGVERVMLDRIGDEVAVATSLVRYRPGSKFATHRHDRGEEFLVLDGVFADEHGRYPRGWYVRNPPGTAHAPFSDEGCLLFVKLRQFAARDDQPLAVDTDAFSTVVANGTTQGRLLHRFGGEVVELLAGGSGAAHVFAPAEAVREVLVLTGVVDVADARLSPLGWFRAPPSQPVPIRFVEPGRIFTKTRPFTDA